jgi:hypothetical protein
MTWSSIVEAIPALVRIEQRIVTSPLPDRMPGFDWCWTAFSRAALRTFWDDAPPHLRNRSALDFALKHLRDAYEASVLNSKSTVDGATDEATG